MYALTILLFLSLFSTGGIARPFGAPCEVLGSMTPPQMAHGNPSVFQPPYVVEFLNPGSETEPECYRTNRDYMIRIRSTDGSSFSGFILQCRDINDNRFGTFISESGNADQWQQHCRRTNSITHVQPNRKEQIVVMWRPNGFAGDFTCQATVLQSLYVWWAKIPSRVMRPCTGDGGNVPFADQQRRRFQFQQRQQ